MAALIAAVVLGGSTSAAAQPADRDSVKSRRGRVVEGLTFLAGGTLALGLHEGGHLVFDAAFDAQPFVKRVALGGIPFFAIAHRGDLSPRRELTISSAGFWVQEATDEWLLSRRPELRRERRPLVKGMLAFNVLASVGYAVVGFARVGPTERDTRGMADSIGVDERAIAALVLAPAVLDAYRYVAPRARWAIWASRITKAGSALLIAKRTTNREP